MESTRRIVLADLDLHAQMRLVVRAAERAEFVDDFVARLVAEVIDAGDIDEEIVAELVFEMRRGGADDLAVDLDGLLAAKFLRLPDFAGKLLLQGGDGVWGGHGFLTELLNRKHMNQ